MQMKAQSQTAGWKLIVSTVKKKGDAEVVTDFMTVEWRLTHYIIKSVHVTNVTKDAKMLPLLIETQQTGQNNSSPGYTNYEQNTN